MGAPVSVTTFGQGGPSTLISINQELQGGVPGFGDGHSGVPSIPQRPRGGRRGGGRDDQVADLEYEKLSDELNAEMAAKNHEVTSLVALQVLLLSS